MAMHLTRRDVEGMGVDPNRVAMELYNNGWDMDENSAMAEIRALSGGSGTFTFTLTKTVNFASTYPAPLAIEATHKT